MSQPLVICQQIHCDWLLLLHKSFNICSNSSHTLTPHYYYYPFVHIESDLIFIYLYHYC